LRSAFPPESLDVTFVWIPKCCNSYPNSGLTSGKGNRKFECRVQQPEQVLAALLRKEPAGRRAFCVRNLNCLLRIIEQLRIGPAKIGGRV
jgi:hypothetical protein